MVESTPPPSSPTSAGAPDGERPVRRTTHAPTRASTSSAGSGGSRRKPTAKKKAAPKKKKTTTTKAKAKAKTTAPRTKKTTTKKATTKKTGAKKKTAPKKAAAAPKKKAATAPRTKAARRKAKPEGAETPDVREAREAREAPEVREVREAPEALEAPRAPSAPQPPAGPPIPPLPEEEDGFVPFEDEEAVREPLRDVPPDLAPAQLLEGVRTGDLHVSALNRLSDEQVVELARALGFEVRPEERRSETLYRLLQEAPPQRRATANAFVEGLLELHPDGYGFLRRPERSYVQHPDDVYVGAGLVRKLGLRAGHWVSGTARPSRPGERLLALQQVEEVNHEDPSALRDVTTFENLTVVYPDQRFLLEVAPEDYEMRVMDLFCPLGRGQRALIVSPPRAGKTVILQKLADAVAHNSPNVDIVVLLVDERPEEVTNMRRSVRGEVIASTFDKPATNHIRIAELVMEKVKRMVEFGRHVVLLLDSITRLGRAYNNTSGPSGRILTGGLEAKALTKPKRFFGAARNIEDGGSLTIVATALVDTGSRMDEVIFEEFKGSGNMEVILDRHLANARIWPAINITASGTRNEDLLLHPEELRRVNLLRKAMSGQTPQGVMEAMREQMAQYRTNAELLMSMG